jgi:hypothetical protein
MKNNLSSKRSETSRIGYFSLMKYNLSSKRNETSRNGYFS